MLNDTTEEDSILTKLVIIVTSLLETSKQMVVPEANFNNDLGADFFSLTEIIMSAEDSFKVNLSCDVMARIKTVGDLLNAIVQAKKRQGKGDSIINFNSQTPSQGKSVLEASIASMKPTYQAPNALEAIARQFTSLPY